MRSLIILGALLVSFSSASAEARSIDYFLPSGTSYDESITTPREFLGYEVGEWHLRHDQLVAYLKRLSDESPRLTFEETGRTHEHRPLVMVTVTSPNNHERLDEIQKQHLQLGDPESDAKPEASWPVVVNMGYSVHGDESSGSNAVPLLAYHLAAGKSSAINTMLDHAIILIDPCLNPDGFSRFAQWANSHRGQQRVPHEEHREHNAVWPGGRTNHYWFDLNRDWLLAQHPESHARLVKYHAWRPNVQTDFHEMGSETTYFFQPGVPERKHPLTPNENVRLTESFAEGHAAALDRIDSLYFSEERFDDFYYGKGSTYPDIHGAVGILFEQASSRGHLRESPHGEFDFGFTIRNHVRTSLSSLEAAVVKRETLLDYQQRFYRDGLALAKAEAFQGYVFGETNDPIRLSEMLTVLQRHQIKVYTLASPLKSFRPGTSYVVPLAQPQYRLIKALFETRTSFTDNIFYDVSTWTLPLAFGIPFDEVANSSEDWLGEVYTKPRPGNRLKLKESYAYAIEWSNYLSPKALYQLQQAAIRVAVATVPLHVTTTEGIKDFPRGTLLIPAARQKLGTREVAKSIARITHNTNQKVHTITTGLTNEGVDLGSARIRVLNPVTPALIIGNGVSHYEAGEAWHLLDHRMGITLPLIETAQLNKIDLHRYSHLLLVDGNYSSLTEDGISKLKTWVQRGGILITQKRAARWAAEKGLLKVRFGDIKAQTDDHDHEHKDDDKKEETPVEPRAYADYHDDEDSKRTSGAIFRASLDLTHPLGYGYETPEIAVFRNSNLCMHPSKNAYATPLRYTYEPLISGYVHADNLERFKNSAGIVADKLGKGAVIGFVDNPNFRAFWYGTNKLYLNALFFGQVLETTEKKEHDDATSAQDHHH